MTQKANPRSRGKRASSNTLAIEQVIKDAETLVNKLHEDPETVRRYLLANVSELVQLAPEDRRADLAETIRNAPACMFTPSIDKVCERCANTPTTNNDRCARCGGALIPSPNAMPERWRLANLFGQSANDGLNAARDKHTAEIANTGPSLVLAREGETIELSAARLLELAQSLKGASYLALSTQWGQPGTRTGSDPEGWEPDSMVIVERRRLINALKAIRTMAPYGIVATIVRDEPIRVPLPGPVSGDCECSQCANSPHGKVKEWFRLSGPVQQKPGRLLLCLEWGHAGRMRFWSCAAWSDPGVVLVPLAERPAVYDAAAE